MSLWSVPPLAIRATHAPQMPPRHVAGRSRPLWSAASARRVAQIEAEKSLATQTRLIAVGHSLRANWLTRPDIWTYGKIKSTRATFHAWGPLPLHPGSRPGCAVLFLCLDTEQQPYKIRCNQGVEGHQALAPARQRGLSAVYVPIGPAGTLYTSPRTLPSGPRRQHSLWRFQKHMFGSEKWPQVGAVGNFWWLARLDLKRKTRTEHVQQNRGVVHLWQYPTGLVQSQFWIHSSRDIKQ
eukprot:489669-Pelagomonas_calceolata.AAC.5